jgi:2-iminobutanoate/2-iminopropanoate deaminase
MSSITLISSVDNAPQAVGPYSIAAKIPGFIFLSGQIPLDPSTGAIVHGGIEAQAIQVMKNIDAVLKGCKSSKEKIFKTTIFLTDLKNFQVVNGLYADWLGGHKPARSTIQVAALPLGADVEIECIVAE